MSIIKHGDRADTSHLPAGHLPTDQKTQQDSAADQRQSAVVSPARAARALAESDRRDRELRARLTAMRWAYRAAWQAAYHAGYERACADLAAAWHAVADPASRGPSHAELERRRWGPEGRQAFGNPRPGDYPGQGAA